MNFSKVFRRPHLKESSDKPFFMHPRPFSYHLPSKESSSPSMKSLNSIPYRIGLSSDRTLGVQTKHRETDEIVRLPMKTNRETSPKHRKDRRHQSQLNANKRWLFRSMETLDGWKGKVFAHRVRTTDSSQSRSRSVDNLADDDSSGNVPITQQQRVVTSNRSIETITNRVISSIGLNRKSSPVASRPTQSPAITVEKQSLVNRSKNDPNRYGINASAILDFRELSSVGFLQSQSRLNENQENFSSTISENRLDDLDSTNQEQEEIISHRSLLGNSYDPTHEADDETADSWDFSLTWIDSLKEQHSPQRKIQFYENLIELLEQDTLNIDELLVLRKVLAKIWPVEDQNNGNSEPSVPLNGSKSLRLPNRTQRHPKLSNLTQHTAQRCSAVIEPPSSDYEPLHEQNSGQMKKSTSLLISAKAKPCLVTNPLEERQENQSTHPTNDQKYPSHLNPFQEEIDNAPSAPPPDSTGPSKESIRRYFERLTLLETIYEKLNMESTKTSTDSTNTTPTIRPVEQRLESKPEIISNLKTQAMSNRSEVKNGSNKLIEMNVDGNGSISSKSSSKRRAPTAPHISQTSVHPMKSPTMFTLASTDVNLPTPIDQQKTIPIRWTSPRLTVTNNDQRQSTAACDDSGQIFVYEPMPNQFEEAATLPRKTARIQQWLSSCQLADDQSSSDPRPIPTRETGPPMEVKMRCVAKPMRAPSVSPSHYPDKHLSTIQTDMEPGRFRTCLKIQLDADKPLHNHTRAAPSRHSSQRSTSNEQARPMSHFHEHVLENQQAVFL